MTTVFGILYYVALACWLLLLARLVVEIVMQLAREWRPSGAVAALLEIVYTVTDPPLRALRKIIPPLRLGGISLDLAFTVLFVLVIVLMQVFGGLASG